MTLRIALQKRLISLYRGGYIGNDVASHLLKDLSKRRDDELRAIYERVSRIS